MSIFLCTINIDSFIENLTGINFKDYYNGRYLEELVRDNGKNSIFENPEELLVGHLFNIIKMIIKEKDLYISGDILKNKEKIRKFREFRKIKYIVNNSEYIKTGFRLI